MKRILIVDDSSSMRGMLKLVLTQNAYEVVEACDGLDALEKLAADQPRINLVICDVNMPRMDGLSFVAQFKQKPESKFAPVVMLTTETSQSLVEKGKSAGAKAWMVKPFQPEQLINVVKKLVG